MFVIVDGIDGSGKGTIVNALTDRERARGAHVLDIREFAMREHRLPEPEEIAGFQVIVSAEPTHAWIGRTIREEIVRDNGRDYGALRTAELFALDRLVLYRRVLMPARANGVHIIQERGVASSLVYQPIQEEPIAIEQLLALEGNVVTLENPPNLCIIVSADPTRAVQRLQLRRVKRDAAIFEKLPILQQLHERYHSPWFRDLLGARGWHVAYLDANGAVEDAVGKAFALWDSAIAQTAPAVRALRA